MKEIKQWICLAPNGNSVSISVHGRPGDAHFKNGQIIQDEVTAKQFPNIFRPYAPAVVKEKVPAKPVVESAPEEPKAPAKPKVVEPVQEKPAKVPTIVEPEEKPATVKAVTKKTIKKSSKKKSVKNT